jgi:hypothetical protein
MRRNVPITLFERLLLQVVDTTPLSVLLLTESQCVTSACVVSLAPMIETFLCTMTVFLLISSERCTNSVGANAASSRRASSFWLGAFRSRALAGLYVRQPVATGADMRLATDCQWLYLVRLADLALLRILVNFCVVAC